MEGGVVDMCDVYAAWWVAWWVVLNVWLESRYVISARIAHLCREKGCLVSDGE